MSRASGRRGVVGMVAALIASLLIVPPASASNINCFTDGPKLTIQFFEFSPSQRIRAFVNADSNVQITDDSLDNRICGSVSGFTSVNVLGAPGRQNFIIDHGGSGGKFPGSWPWDVDLKGGDDVFRMLGTGDRNRFYANRQGDVNVASYRNSGTPHIDLFGVRKIVFEGRGGKDVLGSTAGPGGYGLQGGGALSSSRIKLVLDGGRGADKLFGGRKNDKLRGGRGDDSMNGRGGTDACHGGPGTDTAKNCEHVAGVP